jgi:hypothetical protein
VVPDQCRATHPECDFLRIYGRFAPDWLESVSGANLIVCIAVAEHDALRGGLTNEALVIVIELLVLLHLLALGDDSVTHDRHGARAPMLSDNAHQRVLGPREAG